MPGSPLYNSSAVAGVADPRVEQLCVADCAELSDPGDPSGVRQLDSTQGSPRRSASTSQRGRRIPGAGLTDLQIAIAAVVAIVVIVVGPTLLCKNRSGNMGQDGGGDGSGNGGGGSGLRHAGMSTASIELTAIGRPQQFGDRTMGFANLPAAESTL